MTTDTVTPDTPHALCPTCGCAYATFGEGEPGTPPLECFRCFCADRPPVFRREPIGEVRDGLYCEESEGERWEREAEEERIAEREEARAAT